MQTSQDVKPIAPVSVVVVSRHRLDALLRCITALRQQDHPNLELIIVADPAAIAALQDQPDLKRVTFDRANISQARNLGLAQAAGQVVLFIDDDAIAEPTWASRLSAPFAQKTVVAATGFVRGRNGISFQWRACEVDHLGQDHPIDVPPDTSLHKGSAQRAIKTQGTNAAFRTKTLRAIGGFDPAFEFYLDEADVNLRIAPLGKTAVVPNAQVHHAFLASDKRQANRVPRSLFDIGASTAVFLRKHAKPNVMGQGETLMQAQQMARIRKLRRSFAISASQAAQLKSSLTAGWRSGLLRSHSAAQPLPPPPPFLPLVSAKPTQSVVIAGRFFAKAALHLRAQQAAAQGAVVTVICLAPTLRRHKMQFLPQGYWWQSGGIWGRAERDQPVPWCSFAARIARETARIADVRNI